VYIIYTRTCIYNTHTCIYTRTYIYMYIYTRTCIYNTCIYNIPGTCIYPLCPHQSGSPPSVNSCKYSWAPATGRHVSQLFILDLICIFFWRESTAKIDRKEVKTSKRMWKWFLECKYCKNVGNSCRRRTKQKIKTWTNEPVKIFCQLKPNATKCSRVILEKARKFNVHCFNTSKDRNVFNSRFTT